MEIVDMRGENKGYNGSYCKERRNLCSSYEWQTIRWRGCGFRFVRSARRRGNVFGEVSMFQSRTRLVSEIL